jgi:hypothetical protein
VEKTVLGEINRLRQMSTDQLRDEWLRLNGEPTKSRNRDFLFRRLAWRCQESRHGGLSCDARRRMDELLPGSFVRARTPRSAQDAPRATETPPKVRRDPRLPSPGTIIVKAYNNRVLRVVVHHDGLELDGTMYGSATALAKAVTGSKSINGRLFLGITKRRR